MIRLEDVSKIYQMGDTELRALDHVNLEIKDGEFVSIIGPSGSGKSTMMNIIGCLDIADEGEYYLDDQPIEEYSDDELAKIRNKKIGFIFQNFNLIGSLSARENIELPLIYQKVPREERNKRVEEALKEVGLWERRDHKPKELSGGQQQRIAIARAIATRPSIYLGDEPTGNLDSKTSDEIMKIFKKLHKEGNTVILITHDEDVAKQAHRSIRIKDGHLSEVEEIDSTVY